MAQLRFCRRHRRNLRNTPDLTHAVLVERPVEEAVDTPMESPPQTGTKEISRHFWTPPQKTSQGKETPTPTPLQTETVQTQIQTGQTKAYHPKTMATRDCQNFKDKRDNASSYMWERQSST